MSHVSPPTDTPNVVIESPRARKIAYAAFGWASLTVAVAVGVDLASPAFDITAITTPALAGLGILGVGIGYTASKNTPTV